VPVLGKLLNDATRVKASHGDTIWGDPDWTDEQVQEVLQRGDVFVVNMDGEAVGTFTLQWSDERMWGDAGNGDAVYLHKLAVAEGYNGQGLGKRLIACAEELAMARGINILRLDCETGNQSLCGYYEKLGFRFVRSVSVPPRNPDLGTDYHANLYEREIISGDQTKVSVEPIRITDGEITLDPFTVEDVKVHLANDDEENIKWLSGQKSTEESVLNWILKNQEFWKNNGPVYNFTIRDVDGQLVGMVEANTAHGEDEGFEVGDANISYAIYPMARGRGYVSRAVTLIEEFLRSRNVTRGVIRVAPDNLASLAVPVRLGYIDKGQHVSVDGDLLQMFTKDLGVR
jgi:RimJ/RimL family protein N-acetyltransferase